MGILKRLFGGGQEQASHDIYGYIQKQYSLTATEKDWTFDGAYFDELQSLLSTPEVCVTQIKELDSVDEVCVVLADPVLICARFQKGPVAFRTSLPPLQAQEFVNGLNPEGGRVCCAGKICLVKLI